VSPLRAAHWRLARAARSLAPNWRDRRSLGAFAQVAPLARASRGLAALLALAVRLSPAPGRRTVAAVAPRPALATTPVVV
jgi:hypothetical protein